MKSFFERRDRWGNGYSLWLIGAVVFLLPLMVWSLKHIELENEVAGWLPKDDPQSRILTWYQELFPQEDRILVSWDDCTLTDARIPEFCSHLEGVVAGGVREGGSPYVIEVTEPADLMRRMLAEKLPLPTALDRTHGLLIGSGPLCLSLTEQSRRHSTSVAEAAAKLGREKYGIAVELVTRKLPEPSEAHLSLDDEKSYKLHDALTDYVKNQPQPDLQLAWSRMHIDSSIREKFITDLKALLVPGLGDAPCVTSTWFVEGAMAAVSVNLSSAGIEDPRAALEAIALAARRAGIPEDSLHMGGRPVASTAMNNGVKHSAWNSAVPSWDIYHRSPLLMAVLVSIGLTYVMLKSLRLCLLVQGVSVLSAVAACALVPMMGGSMNMVLAVMPTLLLVISTSGAIHLCNYWKNSGLETCEEAVRHATSTAWVPCFLASGTTAIGLASLVVSSLVPVRDFGIYASIGCLISFVCVLYLLPALMLYWPEKPPKPELNVSHFWNRLGAWLSRHRKFNMMANLAATVACSWGLVHFKTETKVIRYFPDDTRVVKDYQFLEENLSGIVSVDTIVRFNTTQQKNVPFLERAKMVLQVQDALRHHPEVSGTLSLASFLNLDEADEKQMSAMQRRNSHLRENVIGERIHEKLQKGGEDSEVLASMIALPTTSADWKREGDRMLHKAGDEVWRITCQSSILSDYDYKQLTAELSTIADVELAKFSNGKPAHVVTGLIPIFLRTQQALLESLINSFAMAFVLIGLIMVVLLRNVTAAFFSMIPNVAPVAIVFGLLSWAGIRIDIGTMITASVALGIAVDGTLHMMTWFQKLIRDGLSRQEAVARSLEHCGPALWQTSAAIGLGMLTLYPVDLLLISRFGWIMCALIFAALWGDVILLPSLLAGPLGHILEDIEREKKNRDRGGDGTLQAIPGMESDVSPLRQAPGAEHRAASTAARGPHYPRISSVFPRPLTEH